MKTITRDHVRAAFRMLAIIDGVTDPDDIFFSVVKTMLDPKEFESEYHYLIQVGTVYKLVHEHQKELLDQLKVRRY